MAKPIRCYIVQLIVEGIAKPVFITGDKAEADQLAEHYNDQALMERLHNKRKKRKPPAIVRKARAFVSDMPYDRAAIEDSTRPLQGGPTT